MVHLKFYELEIILVTGPVSSRKVSLREKLLWRVLALTTLTFIINKEAVKYEEIFDSNNEFESVDVSSASVIVNETNCKTFGSSWSILGPRPCPPTR